MLRRTSSRSASHYDGITDAWRYIFGEHFHFGFFTSPEVELSAATVALIEELAKLGDITPETRVLDVGCGIGTPAFHLHQKYGCSVLGISTSERGIELAKKDCQARGLSDKVRFLLADGVDNGLAGESFDLVWILESSHLMDRNKLFRECRRVLRPGGCLLLCDVMLRRRIGLSDHFKNLRELRGGYLSGYLSMKKAYGPGRTESFDEYKNKLAAAGFDRVHLVDVSRQTLPTMQGWRANIENHRERILRSFSRRDLDYFEKASHMMEHLFKNEMSGYGLISAVKP